MRGDTSIQNMMAIKKAAEIWDISPWCGDGYSCCAVQRQQQKVEPLN